MSCLADRGPALVLVVTLAFAFGRCLRITEASGCCLRISEPSAPSVWPGDALLLGLGLLDIMLVLLQESGAKAHPRCESAWRLTSQNTADGCGERKRATGRSVSVRAAANWRGRS